MNQLYDGVTDQLRSFLRGNEKSKEIKVPKSTLSPGAYILEVETKEGISTKVILK